MEEKLKEYLKILSEIIKKDSKSRRSGFIAHDEFIRFEHVSSFYRNKKDQINVTLVGGVVLSLDKEGSLFLEQFKKWLKGE